MIRDSATNKAVFGFVIRIRLSFTLDSIRDSSFGEMEIKIRSVIRDSAKLKLRFDS